MRDPWAGRKPWPVRTWIVLSAVYAVAAGVHGVLAWRFRAVWQAALAIVLLAAAIGLAVGAVRAAGRVLRGSYRQVPAHLDRMPGPGVHTRHGEESTCVSGRSK